MDFTLNRDQVARIMSIISPLNKFVDRREKDELHDHGDNFVKGLAEGQAKDA